MGRQKIYDEPGHAHYLTLNTFKRIPLFLRASFCEIILHRLGFDRRKYHSKILGFLIMPDHLHLLIKPGREGGLPNILRDFKKGTAYEILKVLSKEGDKNTLRALTLPRPKADGQWRKVWQRKYFDFNVYSDRKMYEKLVYMHNNPVASGLVGHPSEWRYSSYHNYYNTGERVFEIDRFNAVIDRDVTAQP